MNQMLVHLFFVSIEECHEAFSITCKGCILF